MRLLSLLLAILFLSTPLHAQERDANHLTISQPWSRATAPSQKVGAVFMTISTNDNSADRLIGGRSPGAEAVQIHGHRTDGGVMRMRPVDGIAIPAVGEAVLAPARAKCPVQRAAATTAAHRTPCRPAGTTANRFSPCGMAAILYSPRAMSIDDRDKPSGPLVRRLIRTSRSGVLASLDTETTGTPYASFVLTGCTMDASPLLMLSDLARHSRNIAADQRVSLLIGKLGLDALSQTRATLIGRMEESGDEDAKTRFLRHHAAARSQMAFGDFRLYRLKLESVHFIAGFGRIETLAAADVILSEPDGAALAVAETEIVEHMNADHAEAVHVYACALADRHGLGWKMTGIDPEGLDLARNDAETRLDFESSVDGPESARAELVRLAKRARAQAKL